MCLCVCVHAQESEGSVSVRSPRTGDQTFVSHSFPSEGWEHFSPLKEQQALLIAESSLQPTNINLLRKTGQVKRKSNIVV